MNNTDKNLEELKKIFDDLRKDVNKVCEEYQNRIDEIEKKYGNK